MTDRIDLHAHTIHSDGTSTPTELVDQAAAIGLVALAVTDHDTTSGLEEARVRGSEVGLEVINGVEISASIPTGIVHILAYDFDVEDTAFQALLDRVRIGRNDRNAQMLDKLDALNMPLTLEAVAKYAHGEIVARPHFARAMLEAGYVDDIRSAFRHWLYDGGPAHAPADMPSANEAIEVAARAGGVTSLAHPKQLKLGGKGGYRPTLREFKEAGLTGLEVDHPTQDATWRRRLTDLASEFDLVPTGGSDYHGDAKPYIKLGEGDGSIDVRYAVWERLSARR